MLAAIPWWGYLLIAIGGAYALYFVLFVVLAGIVLAATSSRW